MKILMIGGTGTISSAITRQLAAAGHELWLINRGNRSAELPKGVRLVTGDINEHPDDVANLLIQQTGEEVFDTVCEFIGFLPEQVARDICLFTGMTKQYVFISSASAYNKPVRQHVITEGTALANPHWEYSRNKIACENLLMRAYREQGFPVTIVRPSHTYCERGVPVSVHGTKGSWQVLKRMMQGKPVIVHGDGSSLWTLTWNEDFARGFIGLLGNPQAIGEAFQIMSDESLTWNQIYQTIADALDVDFKPYYIASRCLADIAPAAYDLEGNLLGDKAATVVFDCSKLKRVVPGFCATTPFRQGVRRAVAYLREHPEEQIEDPDFDAWSDHVIETMEQAKKLLRQ
ncbi:MAG: NAD-dependent epimerase/dehydratase family protein [Prevotella sp.]|nr:NAD-dependent epimerase/dehydratase family protein [Prevotella sp.]